MPGVGRRLLRTASGQLGIDDRVLRPQVLTERADLDVVVRVGQHGGVGDFAAGAGGGGDADQRADRPRDVVVVDVFPEISAVRDANRRHLGQIHVAAATQTDDRVRIAVSGKLDGPAGNVEGGFRFASVKHIDGDACRFEGGDDSRDETGRGDRLVGDDEGPCRSQTPCDLFELPDGSPTEDEPSCRREPPRRPLQIGHERRSE